MRRGRIWAMVPLVVLLLARPVGAQEETTARAREDSSRVVSPAECQVTPRAVTEIAQILQLNADGVRPPPYSTISVPLGKVADPATKLSINEATREVLACFNAGDIPRAAALMTEHGVQRAYWRLTIDPAAREATTARLAAPPQPRPEAAQLRLIAVTDSSFLPDGSVVAFVVLSNPLLPPPGPETLLFSFAKQDDRWLVDDWVAFSLTPASSEATPAP